MLWMVLHKNKKDCSLTQRGYHHPWTLEILHSLLDHEMSSNEDEDQLYDNESDFDFLDT